MRLKRLSAIGAVECGTSISLNFMQLEQLGPFLSHSRDIQHLLKTSSNKL